MVAIIVSLLLALSMTPVFNIQSAFADEPAERPATTGGDVPLEGPAEKTGLPAEEEADGPVTATVREDGALIAEGLLYKSESNGAVLVGFEDGDALEREVVVPEKLTDGALEYTVKGVGITEGQSAPGVLSLELPQTVEDVDAKSLAVAMPALARVSVDGRGGAYSSANGMLFKQESITASSDGSTTRIANRELVWAPPAMVIARIPGTCKTVASGAFADDKALETVMVFSIVDSVAKTEKDDKGNVTKEGAFTDEQVSRVNIVTPMETLVYPEGDRISTDAFLAQDAPLNEKHIPWCDCGFSMERFTVGIPYGSTSLAVAVPEDGKVGTPEITIGNYIDYPEWNPKGDTGEPQSGLVFEYKADMTVSVTWKGDKAAIPSHLELPAYVIENGVKTAVTEVAPSAFEGATQLESVVIPEGVTAIGESAFAGCANLKGASLPSTLEMTGDAAFDGCGIDGSVGSSDSASACEEASGDAGAVEEDEWDQERAGRLEDSSDFEDSNSLQSYAFDGLNLSSVTVFGSPDASLLNFSGDGVYVAEQNALYATLGVSGGVFNELGYMDCVRDHATFSYVYTSSGSMKYGSTTITPDSGWWITSFSVSSACQLMVGLVPSSAFNADSHIDKNVAGLANYYDKTAADGRYAKKGTTHTSTNLDDYALKTELPSLSGYATEKWVTDKKYLTSASLNGYMKTADADTKYQPKGSYATTSTTDGLAGRVKVLEGKTHLTLGKTSDTAAAGDHNHDGAYAKQGDFTTLNDTVSGLKTSKADASRVTALETSVTNLTTTVGGKANSSDVYTKSEADGAFAKKGDLKDWALKSDVYTKADADGRYVAESEFGSITYEGMEGVTSKAVMPTAYRAGGVPSLHEPERDGYAFKGWSWSRANADGTQVSGDGADLAEAFSEAGGVTLTAEWERAVPEAKHFFTGDAPLRAGDASDYQTSVIGVRLSDAAGRLGGVGFARDDATGLLKEGASVELRVGNTPDVMEAGTRLDLAVSGEGSAAVSTPDGWSLELAELGPDSWGVYVGVRVRTADVAESPVESFTEGSYVASLVKMSYRFA